MVMVVNALKVIKEIDSLSAEEQEKVFFHVHQLQEAQYHEEQVSISEKRLQDLENGLEEEIPYEQVKEIMRSRP